jgi:hypothetical protein
MFPCVDIRATSTVVAPFLVPARLFHDPVRSAGGEPAAGGTADTARTR